MCPATPSHVSRVHWGFDDPVGKEWSEFQRVRDEIEARIKEFFETGKFSFYTNGYVSGIRNIKIIDLYFKATDI